MGTYKFVILGCLHSGFFGDIKPFAQALNDPIQSKLWGCEHLSQRLIKGKWLDFPIAPPITIGTVQYSFFRHPELYMIPEIQSLVEKINYNEQNNISTPYDEVNSKYHTARNVYNSAYNVSRKLKEALSNGN